ncbi:nucleoid occlusion factor SlmA [Pleionea mediterranea]|jgi:TetR/AcrR family transcriptional regulator|uniref:Nucleoid occlusion factor SlmA n=1 Tax=Pleionea mediterranea TaxID=523701 RepID=A0A316FJQ5_9GAMM|nr:nucleoid occlusion factor SlmA [Pleionea mediterranea]PWK48523.1 TetR family transcriptional regulator [Pleionea mediterranea]
MPAIKKSGSRRQEILECLAHMLETELGARITTARLAKEVGVSEAALYRHFPSKAKMFEGLLEFVEDSVFSRITLISKEKKSSVDSIQLIINLLLGFAQKNPGICRLLMGDALIGEQERLRERVVQFFDRIETQIKQIIRDARIEQRRDHLDSAIIANAIMATAEGKIQQFVRSGFKRMPTENWNEQWRYLANSV